jgi:hypothetical protein
MGMKVAEIDLVYLLKITLEDSFNSIVDEIVGDVLYQLKYKWKVTHLIEKDLYTAKIKGVIPVESLDRRAVLCNFESRGNLKKRPSTLQLFQIAIGEVCTAKEWTIRDKVSGINSKLDVLNNLETATEIYAWVTKEFGSKGDDRDLDKLLDEKNELQDRVEELEKELSATEEKLGALEDENESLKRELAEALAQLKI